MSRRSKISSAISSLITCQPCNSPGSNSPNKPPSTGGDGTTYQLIPLSADAASPGAGDYYGLESGLILFSVQEIEGTLRVVNTTFPLNIYLGDTLASYAGTGSTLPDYSETRMLFWGDRETDPPGDCMAWPTSMPLGSDDEYTSEYLTSAGALEGTEAHKINPVWFSGKARLAAQSKIKDGMSIGELAPADWNTTVRYYRACNLGPNDGIFHDGDYNYWVIRADANGVYAHKLDIPTERASVECCRTMLRSGFVAESDKLKLESYVLGALTAEDSADVTVLTAAQIQDVYAHHDIDVADKAPIDHGWHYSHQRSAGDITEASIVTVHESPNSTPTAFQWASYRYKIVFTVSAATVTAVITEEEAQNNFHLDNSRDWIYVNDWITKKPCRWQNRTENVNVSGDATALYCFYTREDELEVVRYTWEFHSGEYDATVERRGWPTTACEAGSVEGEGWRNGTENVFTLDINADAGLRQWVSAAGGYAQRLSLAWGWGAGSARPCGCYGISQGGDPCSGEGCAQAEHQQIAAGNAMGSGSCNPGASLIYGECYEVEHKTGSAWQIDKYEILYEPNPRKYIIIPDDAESLYAFQYTSFVSSSSVDRTATGENPDALLESRYSSLDSSDVVGWLQQKIALGTSTVNVDCVGDGWGAAAETGGVGTPVERDLSSGKKAEANLITAHEVIPLDTTTPIDWFIPAPDGCMGVEFPAQTSFVNGNTLYRPTKDTLNLSGGYELEEADYTGKEVRFLGFN